MRSTRALVVGAAIAAATGGMTGAAVAAQPNSLRPGVFSFPVLASPDPLITFDIVRLRGAHEVSKGGREVVAWVKLTCTTGSAPPAGIPADQPILLRIPGNLTIAGHRSFGYSGPATLYPLGQSSAAAGSTGVVLKGRFVGRATTRTAAYPTGFQGSFASRACAASPTTFSFPYL